MITEKYYLENGDSYTISDNTFSYFKKDKVKITSKITEKETIYKEPIEDKKQIGFLKNNQK